jgi:hypothetical protein
MKKSVKESAEFVDNLETKTYIELILIIKRISFIHYQL